MVSALTALFWGIFIALIEETVIVYPSYYYSGDLYAGESPHTPYPRVPQAYHFFCGDIYAGEV